MNPSPHQASLTVLSALLEYPDPEFGERVRQGKLAIQSAGVAAEAHFAQFADPALALSTDAREELYTGTFDITPACVPYTSIHLFGEENFKRGEMMAALHARYAQASFDPRGELPDHLSVLLRFAATIGEAELRELAEYCLLGPLDKMIGALHPENPYQALLETVRAVLQAMHPGLQPAVSPLERMRQNGAWCATQSLACGCGVRPNAEPDVAASILQPESAPCIP